jgi:hypothetical protein
MNPVSELYGSRRTHHRRTERIMEHHAHSVSHICACLAGDTKSCTVADIIEIRTKVGFLGLALALVGFGSYALFARARRWWPFKREADEMLTEQKRK